MIIGNHDTTKKAYIIAEAGTSHAGKVRSALQLVDAAHNAGADAVKFQMFTPREELFCPMEGDENRWAWWNQSMMRFSQWKRVKEHADKLGIHFLSSVFQHTGIEWLKKLDPPAWKVASRAAETFPYHNAPGPFLISTGIYFPQPTSPADVFLQCEMKYPTPLSEARFDEDFGGLSDHSGTIYPALDAMARGAQVIEVHMKLDDTGPDATSAIFPCDLKQICEARDGFAAMHQD